MSRQFCAGYHQRRNHEKDSFSYNQPVGIIANIGTEIVFAGM